MAKGINKLVNDIAYDLNTEFNGIPCKVILSSKMNKSKYLIKNEKLIHLNKNFCYENRHDPTPVILTVYDVLRGIQDERQF